MKRISSASMAWHQLMTDVRRLRTGLLLYAGCLLAGTLLWTGWDGPVGRQTTPIIDLLRLTISLLPLLLAAIVVLLDPPDSAEAFWQAKPMSRPILFCSKLLFIALALLLPPVLLSALPGADLAGMKGAVAVPLSLLKHAGWYLLVIAAAAAWSGNRLRLVWTLLALVLLAVSVAMMEGFLHPFESGRRVVNIFRAAAAPAAIPWLLALVAGAYLLPRRRTLLLLLVCGFPLTALLDHTVRHHGRTNERPDVPAFSVRLQEDRLFHLKNEGLYAGLSGRLEIDDLPPPCFAVLRSIEAELIEAGRTTVWSERSEEVYGPYAQGSWRSVYDDRGERAPGTLHGLMKNARVFNTYPDPLRYPEYSALFRYPPGTVAPQTDALWKADLGFEVLRFETAASIPLTPGAQMRFPGFEAVIGQILIEPSNPHTIEIRLRQRMLDAKHFPVFDNSAFVLVWPQEKAVCSVISDNWIAQESFGPVVWREIGLRFGDARSIEDGGHLFTPEGLEGAELRLVNRVHVGWKTVHLEHGVEPPER